MFRQRFIFDPLFIILEITSLQFIFYSSYLLFVLILNYLSNVPFSLNQIYNYYIFTFSSSLGRSSIIGLICAGLASAILFSLIEGRSRKALDFISTTYFIHIFIITIIFKFPKSFIWWFTAFIGWSISTISAEFLSMKSELQEINLENAFSRAEKQI